MDILAFVAYVVALVIFALSGFTSTRHRFINVAAGLFFLALALLLAGLGLTDSRV